MPLTRRRRTDSPLWSSSPAESSDSSREDHHRRHHPRRRGTKRRGDSVDFPSSDHASGDGDVGSVYGSDDSLGDWTESSDDSDTGYRARPGVWPQPQDDEEDATTTLHAQVGEIARRILEQSAPRRPSPTARPSASMLCPSLHQALTLGVARRLEALLAALTRLEQERSWDPDSDSEEDDGLDGRDVVLALASEERSNPHAVDFVQTWETHNEADARARANGHATPGETDDPQALSPVEAATHSPAALEHLHSSQAVAASEDATDSKVDSDVSVSRSDRQTARPARTPPVLAAKIDASLSQTPLRANGHSQGSVQGVRARSQKRARTGKDLRTLLRS